MKIFIVILFSCILLLAETSFPQYTQQDKDLIGTTFIKGFNKDIINKYLSSNDDMKVNAALLSIAQSEDTLWVKRITELNFAKYHKEICFALGELGSCFQSSEYLITEFEALKIKGNISHDILEALGKTGDKNSYTVIAKDYPDKTGVIHNGISLALYYYFTRNISDEKINVNILQSELFYLPSNPERFFEAAFALYRIESKGKLKDKVSTILSDYFTSSYSKNKYTIAGVSYLLSYLKKIKYFPDYNQLFKKIISLNDFSIRVAAVQLLCYYKFQDQNELKEYLNFLNDKNPNVSREAAISVSNLSLSGSLRNYLQKFIYDKIITGNLTVNTKGELLLSYLNLFPGDFSDVLKNFGGKITKEFLYRCGAKYNSSEAAFNYLINSFNNQPDKDKITILTSLLEFQKSFSKNSELKIIIFNSLKSKSAALISIAADGLDSNFVSQNKSMLRTIIYKTCLKYRDSPDYIESIMSLYGLANKIDSLFGEKILNYIVLTKDYSIKKFAFNKLGLSPLRILKAKNNFDELWKRAYKFSEAQITTNKGSFTIKFLPQFAPVTVGNFCYLTEEKILSNNKFHRVVPGFVIQGGDPEETGWGGPGYEINSEFSPLSFSDYMVGMASAGKDTEGSQWFVTTGLYPHLDGRYTIFARVIKGMNIVNNIDQGDKVLTIKLF